MNMSRGKLREGKVLVLRTVILYCSESIVEAENYKNTTGVKTT